MNELHLVKTQTVHIFKPITLVFFLFFVSYSFAAVTPGAATPPGFDLRKIKIKDIEKLTGKKLTLFQKIKFKLLQKLVARVDKREITEKQQNQAEASMILGISSLALMLLWILPFIGFIGILCVPAAILAIIFGAKSLKGNSNTPGTIGIVTGSITLGLIIVAIVVFAILFSGFSFE